MFHRVIAAELKFEMKYITEKFGEPKRQENTNQKSKHSENHHFAVPRSKHLPCLIKYTPL